MGSRIAPSLGTVIPQHFCYNCATREPCLLPVGKVSRPGKHYFVVCFYPSPRCGIKVKVLRVVGQGKISISSCIAFPRITSQPPVGLSGEYSGFRWIRRGMLPSFKPDTVIRFYGWCCVLGSWVSSSSKLFLSPDVQLRAFSVFFPCASPYIPCCPAISGPAAAFKEEADWSLNTKWRFAPVLGTQEWRSRVQQLPITSFTTDLRIFIIAASKERMVGNQ